MFKLFLITVCLAGYSVGLPDGAPAGACGTLMPRHHGASRQTGSAYTLQKSCAGGNCDVKLSGPSAFQGFMLQAFLASDGTTPYGQFTVLDGTSKVVCGGTAVTHTSTDATPNIVVSWSGSASTPVVFKATVAHDYSTIYTDIVSN